MVLAATSEKGSYSGCNAIVSPGQGQRCGGASRGGVEPIHIYKRDLETISKYHPYKYGSAFYLRYQRFLYLQRFSWSRNVEISETLANNQVRFCQNADDWTRLLSLDISFFFSMRLVEISSGEYLSGRVNLLFWHRTTSWGPLTTMKGELHYSILLVVRPNSIISCVSMNLKNYVACEHRMYHSRQPRL